MLSVPVFVMGYIELLPTEKNNLACSSPLSPFKFKVKLVVTVTDFSYDLLVIMETIDSAVMKRTLKVTDEE